MVSLSRVLGDVYRYPTLIETPMSGEDVPQRLSAWQRFMIAIAVTSLLIAVWSALLIPLWLFPSPWCFTGPVIASTIYCVVQRESFFEALVIFILMLLMSAMLRLPIAKLRDYMRSDLGNVATPVEDTSDNNAMHRSQRSGVSSMVKVSPPAR